MNIVTRFLSSDDVVVGLDVPDKRGALEAAASMVEHHHHIHRDAVVRALWRREQIGSTGIGHGIAIPHARIPGISEPIALLMCTKHPMVFGAPDHKPVSVLFVILVPEHANEEHLQILATASEMFADKNFRDQLEAAGEPAKIQRLFGEWATDDATSPIERSAASPHTGPAGLSA
jgi:nitrogen PTS system EIIA component